MKPLFIEPKNMKRLGFDLVSDDKGYLRYENDGKIQFNKDYNDKFAEPKGKIVILINTNYSVDYFYLSIRQDANTRISYNGVCDNEVFLKLLINNIR